MPEPSSAQTDFAMRYERLMELPLAKRLEILNEMAALQERQEAWGLPRQFAENLLTAASFPAPVQRLINVGLGGTFGGATPQGLSAEEVYGAPRTFGQKTALFGGSLLGTIPSMFVPLGNAARATQGLGAGARIARSVGTGAGYGAGFGAVGGVLEPGANLGSVSESTLLGAGMGGGLGLLATGAPMLLRKALGLPATEQVTREIIPEATVAERISADLEPVKVGTPVSPMGLPVGAPTYDVGPITTMGAKTIKVGYPGVNAPGLDVVTGMMVQDAARTVGAKGVATAMLPQVKGLSVLETTATYVDSLGTRDLGQVTTLNKLLKLKALQQASKATIPEEELATHQKLIFTEARRAELGGRSALTDSELVAYRNAQASLLKVKSIPPEAVVTGKEPALQKALGQFWKGEVERIEVVPEGTRYSPRPEGAMVGATKVTYFKPITKELGATAPVVNPTELKTSLSVAAAKSQERVNAMAPGPEREAAQVAHNEEVQAIKTLYDKATKLEAEAQAARAAAGVVEQTGLAAKLEVDRDVGNAVAQAVISHRRSGAPSTVVEPILQSLLKNGYEPPPTIRAKLQEYAPDLLSTLVEKEVAKSDLVSVLVRNGPNEGGVHLETVDGARLGKLQEMGLFAGYHGEVPNFAAQFTEDEARALAQGAGLEPKVPSATSRAVKKAGKLWQQVLQPLRVFMIEKAWGCVEAFRQTFASMTKNRMAHFDNNVMDIFGTYNKLTQAEKDQLWTLLYRQERSPQTLFPDPPQGKAFRTRVDELGNKMTKFREKVLSFEAESYRLKHGYYAKGVTKEFQEAMDRQLQENIDEVRFWLPHHWSDAQDFIMFYNANDGQEFVRVPIKRGLTQKATNREVQRTLELVEQEYGTQLKRDPTAKTILYTYYTPEDYVRAYGKPGAQILPDYDTMLKMLNRVPGIPAAQRVQLLEQAARGSGKPQLIARKWIAGYDQRADESMKYFLSDVEHKLHSRSIIESQELWDKAVREAPDSVRSFAEEYRNNLFSSTPDYTYKFRNIMYTSMMGANIRFLIQQKVQNLMWSTSHFINMHKATILEAAKALGLCERYQFTPTKKLPGDFKTGMELLEKEGAFGAQFLEEGTYRTYAQAINPGVYHSISRTMNWMGNTLEVANRRGAAIQSLYLTRNSGLPMAERVRIAHTDILAIHDAYSAQNRPLLIMKSGRLQPALAVAWMFQSFPARTIAQMAGMLTKGGSKKALALQAAILTAGAGALGWPGIKTASSVYRFGTGGGDLEGDIHDALSNVQAALYRQLGMDPDSVKHAALKGADIMLYGGLGSVGIDATTFLGINNFPYGDWQDVAGLYMGLLQKGKKTKDAMMQGDWYKVVQNGMPLTQVQRMMTAYKWWKDGEIRDFNDVPLVGRDGKKIKTGGVDVAEAVLGVPTIDKTRSYQESTHRAALLEGMHKRNATFNMDIAKALFNKDKAALQKLQDKRKEWNGAIRDRLRKGEDVTEEFMLKPNPASIRYNLKLLTLGRTMQSVKTVAERRMLLEQVRKYGEQKQQR